MLSANQLDKVSTGRTWIASKAQSLGLIDSVMSWEDSMGNFADSLPSRGNPRTAIALAQVKAKARSVI